MTKFTFGTATPSGPASSLDQLCALEHSDFVRCAYLTILGRQPDPDGMAYYLDRLAAGVSKLTILGQLRGSEEAGRHDPGIAGFDRALRRHRRSNVPFVGGLVRLFTKAEADDGAARRERAAMRQIGRIEARLLASHIDIVDRMEELQRLVRHLAGGGLSVPMAPLSRSADAQHEFGLSRAGGGMAVPWSEISSK